MYSKEYEWIKYYDSYKNGYNNNSGLKDGAPSSLNLTKKKIYCYDLDGNFIKAYDGLKDAELELGIPNTNISKAARQIDRVIAGDYQWRYEYFEKIPPYKRTCRFKHKPDHCNIKVNQYDKNFNFIKTHESITAAAEETGANATCIIKICKTKGQGYRKTSGGYIWRYTEEEKEEE